MRTVYVILAGYSDSGVDYVDVLGVFSTEATAAKVYSLIKASEPSKSLRIVPTNLDMVE